jgi:hypothetical protein
LIANARSRRAGGTRTELDKPFVGTNGVAHDIAATKPLGLGPDQNAVKSLQTWKFEPATLDGNPVAVKLRGSVSFHILKR